MRTPDPAGADGVRDTMGLKGLRPGADGERETLAPVLNGFMHRV
jgi:hypothetical protein